MSSPFKDLKVIELASVLAGPAVGMFFAELGADVKKVEHPKLGDVTRSWKNKAEHPEAPISAYYATVNFGKSSERLDLKTDQGQHRLHELLTTADILIHNFREKDVAKMKLGPASLLAQYPSLIIGRITGFSSDPNRVAYDAVMQAETGHMSMNGTPESGPLKFPFALIDMLAAHQLKEGLLTALFERAQHGRGSYVEASLEDSALCGLANQGTNFLMSGQVPELAGSLHPNIAPYGETCVCLGGEYVMLAIGSDKQFAAFCEIIGRPELITLENYASNPARLSHRAALKKELDKSISQIQRDKLLNACKLEGVPVAAVKRVDEVLQSPYAQSLVLNEQKEGMQINCMPSVAFKRFTLADLAE